MATTTVVFNNATGSDTAASGAGPGNGIVSGSALSGTAASFAGSVVTLDGSPDLSAFSATTWILWLATSTGRQFFDLSSANDGADTVTCVNAPAGTASGLTWGIGGKRQTLDATSSRTLFNSNGMKTGWDVLIEDDQSIATEITLLGSGSFGGTNQCFYMRGPTSGRVTITQTGSNQCHFIVDNPSRIQGLKFANTHATKGEAAVKIRTGQCVMVDLESDTTNKVKALVGWNYLADSGAQECYDCLAVSCTVAGFYDSVGTTSKFKFINCTMRNNTGQGILVKGDSLVVDDCIISGNGSDGIAMTMNGVSIVDIRNCTIHGNTGDGVDVSASNGFNQFLFHNNNVTANGGYGVRGNSTYISSRRPVVDFNNYGTGATANTSGSHTGFVTGDHDLAVDPGYTDAANYDFSVGTNVKAKGLPDATRRMGGNPAQGPVAYVDIGVQRQEAAGGGVFSPFPGQ